MSDINQLAYSKCRNCGKDLVTFGWGTAFNVCCINMHCELFRKPINLEKRGERNGEKENAGRRVLCHNCGYIRPILSMVWHGLYRLCGACVQKYRLAKWAGKVKDIEDFVLDGD